MKRQYEHDNSYKGKPLIGTGLQFRNSVHYRHGREQNSMQADMVLEKVLYLVEGSRAECSIS